VDIKYLIKKLGVADLTEDKNGFLETLRNLTVAEDISLKRMKKILFEIENQNGHIYIAKRDKEIIGTATLFVEQKFIHGGGKVGHIEDVAIRKEYEGNGVASEIINSLIKIAKENGCYKIILDCKDKLLPFYEKFGFAHSDNCMRLNL
jgi:glucosamine-phosphate N-acetyltransferase